MMITKHFVTTMAFTGCLLGLLACNSKADIQGSKHEAEERNEAKFTFKKEASDAQFLVEAAEINVEDIKLGQLARQKGLSSQVQDLGKAMEIEHTQLLNEVRRLARNKDISIPMTQTDETEAVFDRFDLMNTDEFDIAYTQRMVAGHKTAIATFEKASINAYDDEIKLWAINVLPQLKAHLQHANRCENALKTF